MRIMSTIHICAIINYDYENRVRDMEYLNYIIKFLVIIIIYIILVRIVRIIYLDLKGADAKEETIEPGGFALEVMDSPDTLPVSIGSVYPLRRDAKIGRRKDNDIVLDDPFVSGHHARLLFEEDRLFIQDMKSTNGTFLNGKMIKNSHELNIGDLLKIGRVTFKVIG